MTETFLCRSCLTHHPLAGRRLAPNGKPVCARCFAKADKARRQPSVARNKAKYNQKNYQRGTIERLLKGTGS